MKAQFSPFPLALLVSLFCLNASPASACLQAPFEAAVGDDFVATLQGSNILSEGWEPAALNNAQYAYHHKDGYTFTMFRNDESDYSLWLYEALDRATQPGTVWRVRTKGVGISDAYFVSEFYIMTNTRSFGSRARVEPTVSGSDIPAFLVRCQ